MEIKQVCGEEYEEVIQWLFGKDVEIEKEIDIAMCQYYKDPYIYYTKEIKDLVNTKPMQALGKKPQLGEVIRIHENAYHTRLEHSKGAYRRALEFLTIQYRKPEWRKHIEENGQKQYLVDILVRMLTHDIGHGMSSHSIETVIGKEDCDHEKIGQAILENNTEVKDAIDKIKVDEIHSKKDNNNLDTLCAGNIDFDRIDYLLRDYLYVIQNKKNKDIIFLEEMIQKIYHGCDLEEVDGEQKYVYQEEVMQDINAFLNVRCLMYQEIYRNNQVEKVENETKELFVYLLEHNIAPEIENPLKEFYQKEIHDMDLDKYIETNYYTQLNYLLEVREKVTDKHLIDRIDNCLPNIRALEYLTANIETKEKENQRFMFHLNKIREGTVDLSQQKNYELEYEENACEIRYFKRYNPKDAIYIKKQNNTIVTYEDYMEEKGIQQKFKEEGFEFCDE